MPCLRAGTAPTSLSSKHARPADAPSVLARLSSRRCQPASFVSRSGLTGIAPSHFHRQANITVSSEMTETPVRARSRIALRAASTSSSRTKSVTCSPHVANVGSSCRRCSRNGTSQRLSRSSTRKKKSPTCRSGGDFDYVDGAIAEIQDDKVRATPTRIANRERELRIRKSMGRAAQVPKNRLLELIHRYSVASILLCFTW